MNHIIKKMSANYDIIDSGILYSFYAQGPIRIELNTEKEHEFSIEFQFENNNKKQSDLKISVDGSQKLITFTCINFNNSLGTGTTQPIELAENNNKKMFIHFWGFSLGQDAVKKIEYCIFVER